MTCFRGTKGEVEVCERQTLICAAKGVPSGEDVVADAASLALDSAGDAHAACAALAGDLAVRVGLLLGAGDVT